MFKESTQFMEIKSELSNSLDLYTYFYCCANGFVTYNLYENELFHSFTIHCNDALFSKMKVKDLIELDSIDYFKHTIYLKNGTQYEFAGSISWVKEEEN